MTTTMTPQQIAVTATTSQAKALREWYGPNWAHEVLSDADSAAEDCRPHPLSEPTFSDYGDSKSDAYAAWIEIESKITH